jgi:hypothetical protein
MLLDIINGQYRKIAIWSHCERYGAKSSDSTSQVIHQQCLICYRIFQAFLHWCVDRVID